VIPFGRRAGLIQWVHRTTTTYSLYRRWQQREASLVADGTGTEAAEKVAKMILMKPTENWQSSVKKKLKEKSIPKSVSRRHWPKEILLDVLEHLLEQTPCNFVFNELWLSSSSFLHGHFRQKSFSSSLAVMSIVGYILGLGDRHLDNVLLDFEQAQVIHIDYNVCFDKGRRLRVPEKVPFRLTQNFVHAMGPFGLEGTFTSVCSKYLKQFWFSSLIMIANALTELKKRKGIILNLLDTFLHDPLVDWQDALGDYAVLQRAEMQVNADLICQTVG
jgi:phosphatidylinositol kinase/protein kinase (PI-3  family)